jgi:hypothetical protein
MPARITAWTDSANRALASLGQGRIESLEEKTQSARLCNQFLEEAINHVAGYHQWNSTRTRILLARDLTAPISGWLYQYHLPADFLILARDDRGNAMVYADDSDAGGVIAFHIEGNYLLTDSATVWLVYHKSPETPGGYPPAFINAITYALAERLSTIVTTNDALRSLTAAKAAKVLAEAIAADSGNTSRLSPEAERGYDFTYEVR